MNEIKKSERKVARLAAQLEVAKEELRVLLEGEGNLVAQLSLTSRTVAILEKEGIVSESELILKTPGDLYKIENMGRRRVKEVVTALAKRGLTLRSS